MAKQRKRERRKEERRRILHHDPPRVGFVVMTSEPLAEVILQIATEENWSTSRVIHEVLEAALGGRMKARRKK